MANNNKNMCHLIPSNRFLYGFPDPSQFAAAKVTHYSAMPHRPSYCCCLPSETYGRNGATQILISFFTELPVPVPPQAAGVVGTFNVLDICEASLQNGPYVAEIENA